MTDDQRRPMEQLGLSVFIPVFSLCGVTVWLDQDFGTALKGSDVKISYLRKNKNRPEK